MRYFFLTIREAFRAYRRSKRYHYRSRGTLHPPDRRVASRLHGMMSSVSGNGNWIGISKIGPAPSGSIVFVPIDARKIAAWP